MAIVTGAGLGYTIVMDSMSTRLHCQLVGGIDYRESWNRQCTVIEAQNHGKVRGGETVTGVHRSAKGIQNKRVTGSMEKEWAQKYTGEKVSRFTRMYGVYMDMEI